VPADASGRDRTFEGGAADDVDDAPHERAKWQPQPSMGTVQILFGGTIVSDL
jgi:hypothetical protein